MTSPRSDASETLHALLARLRAERGLSVAQLAAQTGLSPNAVRWIERGITQPKPESLRALAGALDVPYELLLQKAGYLEAAPVPSDEQELLAAYRVLPPPQQELVRQLIAALAEAAQRTANGGGAGQAPAC